MKEWMLFAEVLRNSARVFEEKASWPSVPEAIRHNLLVQAMSYRAVASAADSVVSALTKGLNLDDCIRRTKEGIG